MYREYLKSFPRDPSDRYAKALGGAHGFNGGRRQINTRDFDSNDEWTKKLRNRIVEFGVTLN
jgi:hypothetical protein